MDAKSESSYFNKTFLDFSENSTLNSYSRFQCRDRGHRSAVSLQRSISGVSNPDLVLGTNTKETGFFILTAVCSEGFSSINPVCDRSCESRMTFADYFFLTFYDFFLSSN
ncbi:hypothetical protein [Microcoleus asticus]|uniref:Uncharacterized protein n=1 Tax=Microcoleus asticus IPMA8 TaxID=2563858 RepID=A0ABX2CSI9_9CYAN|nr:hypothetical protein [Microcoleus asticus]NQE32608.1 hypothetical protein [Microcoleus asticus IPMA8]